MSKEGLMAGVEKNYGSMGGGDDIHVAFPGSSGGFFDGAQFYRLCDSIASNVFTLSKHAATLEKTLKTIGSQNDSKMVRDSVHIVQTTANKTLTETASDIKTIGALVNKARDFQGTNPKEVKMRVTKLTSDFQSAAQKYTDVQKQIVSKMKSTVLPPSANTSMSESEDHSESLVASEAQQQHQLQLQQELEFEQGLLLEREERIRQIEGDILDVNDIMRELATLVHEQGEAVNTIEGNIDSAYNEVEAGREELQKASTYQTKYRKRMFCLLAVGLVILIIVVIILVTQLRK